MVAPVSGGTSRTDPQRRRPTWRSDRGAFGPVMNGKALIRVKFAEKPELPPRARRELGVLVGGSRGVGSGMGLEVPGPSCLGVLFGEFPEYSVE